MWSKFEKCKWLRKAFFRICILLWCKFTWQLSTLNVKCIFFKVFAPKIYKHEGSLQYVKIVRYEPEKKKNQFEYRCKHRQER